MQHPQPDGWNHFNRWHVRMRASHGPQQVQSHGQNSAQSGSRLQTVRRHVLSRLQTTACLDALMKFLDEAVTFMVMNQFPRIIEFGDRKTGRQYPMCRRFIVRKSQNLFCARVHHQRTLQYRALANGKIRPASTESPDKLPESTNLKTCRG